MTPVVENEDDLTAAVDALAHKNAGRLTTMTERQQHKYVRRSIQGPRGRIRNLGRGRERSLLSDQRARPSWRLSSTAFFVRGRSDAIGMAEDLGDGAPHLAHAMPRTVQ